MGELEGGVLFRRVVTFGDARLNHHGGVAALLELAFVGYRPNDVTTLQTECGTESCQGCDQHTDDDFDDLLPGHNS